MLPPPEPKDTLDAMAMQTMGAAQPAASGVDVANGPQGRPHRLAVDRLAID